MSDSPLRPAFGTLAWAEQNNGRLSAGEQVRESAKALRTVSAATPGTIRGLLGRPRRDATQLDPSAIVVPDSTFARAALEEARDSVEDATVQHSLRTYYWGMLLAARDGRSPDPEIAYVASLLHDVTWGDRYRDFAPDGGAPIPCFAARGGQIALDWAARNGWPADRAAIAADAISAHVNITLGPEHTDEARVVQGGAGVDVLALRYDELAPATVAAVLARHPRTGWLDSIGHFRAEAHPGTRAALMRRLGMMQLARRTAFRD